MSPSLFLEYIPVADRFLGLGLGLAEEWRFFPRLGLGLGRENNSSARLGLGKTQRPLGSASAKFNEFTEDSTEDLF